MRIILLGVCILLSMSMASMAAEHDLLTSILKDHVKGNRVDYRSLTRDVKLNEYIHQLEKTDPDSLPSEKSKFAFWLNVYTAYSLKVIVDHYPIKSLDQLNFGGLVVSVLLKKTVWDKPSVLVNGKRLTLRAIDHEILRPQFKDPRIQFAIICGAISCAPPMTEAFEAGTIDAQLEEQAKHFFNDLELNSFDTLNKKATLSVLMKASMKEFGSSEKDLLLYAAKFLPEDTAAAIKGDVDHWKIKYSSYDLTLNDTTLDKK